MWYSRTGIGNYVTHNEIMKYWRIEIIGVKVLENGKLVLDNGAYVFKGKTEQGAIKGAERYCKDLIKKYESAKCYKSVAYKVGSTLYECDFYGRKR